MPWKQQRTIVVGSISISRHCNRVHVAWVCQLWNTFKFRHPPKMRPCLCRWWPTSKLHYHQIRISVLFRRLEVSKNAAKVFGAPGGVYATKFDDVQSPSS
ncbi:unnamed protein product [Ectocarpus sp. 8 AP-2014]